MDRHLDAGIFLLEGARRHLIERGRAAAVEHQRALLLCLLVEVLRRRLDRSLGRGSPEHPATPACCHEARRTGRAIQQERPVRWWQSAVLYQIYPRSFQDTDGDGIGDLAGILARLPYLVDLGVDAIWLSPIFPSPMADFGYDISDYTDIAPLFGSLADFDALVAAAHRSGLRVLLDLVPNHTSDRHPRVVHSRRPRGGGQ